MRGAVLIALAAAIGNMLQGWDNATIAGFTSVHSCSFDLHIQNFSSFEMLEILKSLA